MGDPITMPAIDIQGIADDAARDVLARAAAASGVAGQVGADVAAIGATSGGGVAETGAPPGAQIINPPAGPVAEAPVTEGVQTASTADAAAATGLGQVIGGAGGGDGNVRIESWRPAVVGSAGSGASGGHVHASEEHSHGSWRFKDLARLERIGPEGHGDFEKAVNAQRDAHSTMKAAPADAAARTRYAEAKKKADRLRAEADDVHGDPEKDEKTWWGKWVRPGLGDFATIMSPVGSILQGVGAIITARNNPHFAQYHQADVQAQGAREARRDKKKELDAAGEQRADKLADRVAQERAARAQAREAQKAEAAKATASMFAKKGAGGEGGQNSMSRDGATGRMAHHAELQQIMDQRNRGIKV